MHFGRDLYLSLKEKIKQMHIFKFSNCSVVVPGNQHFCKPAEVVPEIGPLCVQGCG